MLDLHLFGLFLVGECFFLHLPLELLLVEAHTLPTDIKVAFPAIVKLVEVAATEMTFPLAFKFSQS